MTLAFWRGFFRRGRLIWLLLLPAALAQIWAQGAGAAEKGELPIPAATLALMAAKDTTPAAPILMRAYKKESEIEIWKQNSAGRYVFLKSFPICRWSGTLGPKTTEGDRQTPEGFYAVGATQMNPNSHYYLSFDTGYPNAYDRAHGGSGSSVMVHGTCSSAGCFAMTDKGVGEIFALAREALRGGQSGFQFQSYPFRMTAQNMARYRADPNIAFWRELKEGSDRFEATGEELAVSVAGGRYAFAPSADPVEGGGGAGAPRAGAGARRRLRRRGQRRRAHGLFGRRPESLFRRAASQGRQARRGQPPRSARLCRDRRGGDARARDLRQKRALSRGRPQWAGAGEARAGARWRARRGQQPPAQAQPRIYFFAAHATPLPATEPLTLAPEPLSYKLGRPAPQQTVIAGAMPILPAVWFD